MATAQKFEMERRISKKKFPTASLNYLQEHFPEVEKIKYFLEKNRDDIIHFEAKFRYQDEYYSVEFYENGNLQDVEKKIVFGAIEQNIQSFIRNQWAADFKRYAIVKCQEQKALDKLRYEIEVKGKNRYGTAYYEYLFESDGSFVRREMIILTPDDMVLY